MFTRFCSTAWVVASVPASWRLHVLPSYRLRSHIVPDRPPRVHKLLKPGWSRFGGICRPDGLEHAWNRSAARVSWGAAGEPQNEYQPICPWRNPRERLSGGSATLNHCRRPDHDCPDSHLPCVDRLDGLRGDLLRGQSRRQRRQRRHDEHSRSGPVNVGADGAVGFPDGSPAREIEKPVGPTAPVALDTVP